MSLRSAVHISTGRDIFKGAVRIQLRQEFNRKLSSPDKNKANSAF